MLKGPHAVLAVLPKAYDKVTIFLQLFPVVGSGNTIFSQFRIAVGLGVLGSMQGFGCNFGRFNLKGGRIFLLN